MDREDCIFPLGQVQHTLFLVGKLNADFESPESSM